MGAEWGWKGRQEHRGQENGRGNVCLLFSCPPFSCLPVMSPPLWQESHDVTTGGSPERQSGVIDWPRQPSRNATTGRPGRKAGKWGAGK